jgi:hypothetical protein
MNGEGTGGEKRMYHIGGKAKRKKTTMRELVSALKDSN